MLQSHAVVSNGYHRDLRKVLRARREPSAMDALCAEYRGFVRLKASSYFMAGGSADDLVQEGMIGLWEAVIGYNGVDSSFRNFAELCITRQIITAVKTATRRKHRMLNECERFGVPLRDTSNTLEDIVGDPAADALGHLLIHEELETLAGRVHLELSGLEFEVLRCMMNDMSYRQIADVLDIPTKSVDNALQRIQRKLTGPPKVQQPIRPGWQNCPSEAIIELLCAINEAGGRVEDEAGGTVRKLSGMLGKSRYQVSQIFQDARRRGLICAETKPPRTYAVWLPET